MVQRIEVNKKCINRHRKMLIGLNVSYFQESNLSYRVGEVMQSLQMFPVNIIMAFCIFITIFLTNICSNTVTASIFIPIVAELAKSLEIHPVYFMMPTALASSMAFTLPVRFVRFILKIINNS